jgi:Icc-related predicted phosphoesterase
MRIQYCSDLHLELEQNSRYFETAPLTVSGEILILAGDIVPLHDLYLSNPFFRFISNNYKQVFWVPGNHEFYHKNISDYSSSYNIPVYRNINIVNNIELHHSGIQFIFSTLWSKINRGNEKSIERGVADFEFISQGNKKFDAILFNKLHDVSLGFIKQALSNKQKKTVVIAHHLPSVLCNSQVHNTSLINEAFCVDLTDYIRECNVNFWIHGHSHFNYHPIIIGNTIMLTNQLGYTNLNESKGFRHHAYFSI